MDYARILDFGTELGYRIAMCGGETFRVEESISLVLRSYGLEAQVFAIPNCLTVSIITPDGTPMTQMRRIDDHGNDMSGLERYNALSRKLCRETPDYDTAVKWLEETDKSVEKYSFPWILLGYFLGPFGFCIFYGGSLIDSLFSGICGLLVGMVGHGMKKLQSNVFFRTCISSFLMGLLAYFFAVAGFVSNADSVIIGALMPLVPGLLFVNSIRDVIYGDTNSGINRLIQVLLVALAIALGTAGALTVMGKLFTLPTPAETVAYSFLTENLAALVGCIGFAILFNVHGKGFALCALGGVIAWCAYRLTLCLGGSVTFGFLISAGSSSLYAEIMARVRKCPAPPYLLVSIFPMIPGAGVYYTMTFAVYNDMANFVSKGMQTVASAGAMALGIIVVSSLFRLYGVWHIRRYFEKHR